MNNLLIFCIAFTAVFMVVADNDKEHLAKEIGVLLEEVNNILQSIDDFERNTNITLTNVTTQYHDYSKHLKDEEEDLKGFTNDYCNTCKDDFNDYNVSKALYDSLADEIKTYSDTVIPRIPQFKNWSHDLEELSKNLSNCNEDKKCIANVSAIFTDIQNNASSLIKSKTVQNEIVNITKVVNQSVNLVLKEISSKGNLALTCLTELEKVKKEIDQDVSNVTLTIKTTIETVSNHKLNISQLTDADIKNFENFVSTNIKNATNEIEKQEECAKVNISSCKSQQPDWDDTRNNFLVEFNYTILTIRNSSLKVLDVNMEKLKKIDLNGNKLLGDLKDCPDLSCIQDMTKEVGRQFDDCFDQISKCTNKTKQSVYDFYNSRKIIETNFTNYSSGMINEIRNEIIECIQFIEEGINKTELTEKIDALMKSVNDTETNILKLEDEMTNDLTQYKKDNMVVVFKQYLKINNSIEGNEAKLNIYHKYCRNTENDFKVYKEDFFKIWKEYDNTYRNFTEYMMKELHENSTKLTEINSKLGPCKQEEFDCLKAVYGSLKKYINLTKDLDNLMETLEHSIQERNKTFVASIEDSGREMIATGNQAVQCLHNLTIFMDDLKSKFIIPLNNTMERAYSNITGEFTHAKLLARKLNIRFENNLTESLSGKENEAEEIKHKLIKLNITGELCGEDQTDFHKISKNYCEMYDSYIDEGENLLMERENETFLQLKGYAEIQVRVQRDFSECNDEVCLRKVINDSVNHLTNLTGSITNVVNSFIEKIAQWISTLESNKTSINENFSASLNEYYKPVLYCLSQMKNSTDQVVELDHPRSEIPNYLMKQLNNITTRMEVDQRNFVNKITASLNDTNEEIEHKRNEAHKKQLDISSCDKKTTDMENKINSSLESFSTRLKEFKANITTKVTESIQYIQAFDSATKDTFENISTCLEKSCMDRFVEQFKNESLHDLDLSRKKENFTVSYSEGRLSSFEQLRNQYLNETLVDLEETKRNVLSCIRRIENSGCLHLSNFLLLCFVILFQIYTSYN